MKRLITYRHLNEYRHPAVMVKVISADLRTVEIEWNIYSKLEEELRRLKISEEEIVSIVKMTYYQI